MWTERILGHHSTADGLNAGISLREKLAEPRIGQTHQRTQEMLSADEVVTKIPGFTAGYLYYPVACGRNSSAHQEE